MKSFYQHVKDYFAKVNRMLLLFLVTVLFVKIWIKAAALLFFLVLFRKEFFKKDNYRRSFTWFYLGMTGMAILQILLSLPGISANYLFTAVTGIFFWLACLCAAFIVRHFTEKLSAETLHRTLAFFFYLNAAVTLVQLGLIMVDAGSLNPYRFQGMHQKYFIGTGDLLTGISFDVSTTNALLSAAAVIFFLLRFQYRSALLCMGVLLLTGSNITILLLLAILAVLFVTGSNRAQKSVITGCCLLLAVFMVKISPQNNRYLEEAWKKITGTKKEIKTAAASKPPRITERPDSTLSPEERKEKTATLYLDSLNRLLLEKKAEVKTMPPAGAIAVVNGVPEKPAIPKDNIHSEPFQRRRDTTLLQKELLDFALKSVPGFDTGHLKTVPYKLPGKLVAFQQTLAYLRSHPLKLITGAGIGNFSSKLAFRATGLRVAGGYPPRFVYVNEAFRQYHLDLFLTYFSRDIELHSLINSPNSVYDQLLAEYGLPGLAIFFVFYLGFFLRKIKRRNYHLPLLLLLLGAFGIEYWFEQLSVVILFELMLLTGRKEVHHE